MGQEVACQSRATTRMPSCPLILLRFASRPVRHRLHAPNRCVRGTWSLFRSSSHSTPSPSHRMSRRRPAFRFVTLRCCKPHFPHPSKPPPPHHPLCTSIGSSLPIHRSRPASHRRGTRRSICSLYHQFRSVLSFGDRYQKRNSTLRSLSVSHSHLSCIYHRPLHLFGGRRSGFSYAVDSTIVP